MATNYQRGRAFEYRARDRLYKEGAVFVMRAAQSKGKADLIALWPSTANIWLGGERTPLPGQVQLVQCKTGSARMSKADKRELLELAQRAGAKAVLAEPGPKGRGVVFTTIKEEDL